MRLQRCSVGGADERIRTLDFEINKEASSSSLNPPANSIINPNQFHFISYMSTHKSHPCLPIFVVATAGLADKKSRPNVWLSIRERLTIQSIGYDTASTLSMVEAFKKEKRTLPVPAFSLTRYLKSLPQQEIGRAHV